MRVSFALPAIASLCAVACSGPKATTPPDAGASCSRSGAAAEDEPPRVDAVKELFAPLDRACVAATGKGLSPSLECECESGGARQTFVSHNGNARCLAARPTLDGAAACRGADGKLVAADPAALDVCLDEIAAVSERPELVGSGTLLGFRLPPAGDPGLAASRDGLVQWANARLVGAASVPARLWAQYLVTDTAKVQLGQPSAAILEAGIRSAIGQEWSDHLGVFGGFDDLIFEPSTDALDQVLGASPLAAADLARLAPAPAALPDAGESQRRDALARAYAQVVRDRTVNPPFVHGRAFGPQADGCAGSCAVRTDWTALGDGVEVMRERAYVWGSIARDVLWVRQRGASIGVVALGPSQVPSLLLTFDGGADEAALHLDVAAYDRLWHRLGAKHYGAALDARRLRSLAAAACPVPGQAIGVCETSSVDLLSSDALTAHIALGPSLSDGAGGSLFGWAANPGGDFALYAFGASERRLGLVPWPSGDDTDPGHAPAVAGAILESNGDARFVPLSPTACSDEFDRWYGAAAGLVRVMNVSFAESRHYDDCTTRFAPRLAATEGELLWVAAAGNNGDGTAPAGQEAPGSLCPQALAGRKNLVVVAASNGDERAGYSNYGEQFADLAAPGNAGQLQGTSFAAPRVAGVASRIAMDHPELPPSFVRAALLASSRVTPALHDVVRSGGILDAATARGVADCFAIALRDQPGAALDEPLVRRCLQAAGYAGAIDDKVTLLRDRGSVF